MVLPSAAVMAGPSVLLTPSNGIETANSSPVSGLPVIVPSNGGSGAALLIIRDA